MSAGGGRRAIAAALGANLTIAAAKLVGFLVTASSALLAESVHSLADSGNQVLLLVGQQRGAREADRRHPFGYGRERYFYSFVVALVLFSLGSLFALYEGVQKVREPHALTTPAVAIGILVFAILAEAYSFKTAIGESREGKGSGSWYAFIRHSKSPELPVVLLEDLAALIGLAFALLGVVLSLVLDAPRWDGIGTLAIGGLLAVVAAVLAVEMKGLLIGESASRRAVEAISAALVNGLTVTRVIHLRTMHLGPDELLVAAKISLAPGLALPAVARAIDDAEARVRAVEPLARVIYLEPDLDRGTLSASEPYGRS